MRTRTFLRMAGMGLALGSAVAVAVPAGAESDPCREWRGEHRFYEAEAVRLFLTGGSQRSVDEALFELLQREAYLTSCDQSVRDARVDLVGWRLVDRPADEYGSAVVESLLERAGFDVSLVNVVGPTLAMPGQPRRRPGPSGRRLAR